MTFAQAEQMELQPPTPLSDSDEERMSVETLRRRPLVKLLSKRHTVRKFFDSGEYFSLRQGKQLQDLLPGGAPVDACLPRSQPVTFKSTKSNKDAVYDEAPQRLFKAQFSISDY